MNRISISLLGMLASLSLLPLSFGHPGHEGDHVRSDKSVDTKNSHPRVWTLVSHGSKEVGTFVTLRDETIQIRRDDESLIQLKLSDLRVEDQQWVADRTSFIRRANVLDVAVGSTGSGSVDPDEQRALELPMLLAQVSQKKPPMEAKGTPELARAFEAFVKTKAVKTRWDERYFYVESNGIPDHQMMVGITAWQQQVPIPQKYFGDNSWQIPLHPVPAKKPQSAKGAFLRGAIALAVNGIPIFNPLNNRGDDAYLFGELDEFGGHCGRADDYHYHIAPVHLQKSVGPGLPIAYALDGYPIYGYEEADGSPVTGLDSLNGHKDKNGNYHYHATKKYPYLNGGFFGEVVERGGQVDPQPRAEPLRPALPPMRDAKIVDFKETKPGCYLLTYEVNGRKGTVGYTLGSDGSASFTFKDTSGKESTETYHVRERRGGGGPGSQPPPKRSDENPPRGDGKRPPRNDDRPPPPDRKENRPNPTKEQAESTKRNSTLPKLVVTSPVFDPGGNIPVEFTGDGASASPPIEWSDVPKGTKTFAVNVWHVPGPDDIKSYWVVYNIPANVSMLVKNNKAIGTIGVNDKNRREYDPMKSKGPGSKLYHITVYALSEELTIAPEKANRASLLDAIKDITLAEGTLDFRYERGK